MFFKNSIFLSLRAILATCVAISDSSLEDKAKNKLTNKINQGVSTLSGKISENITSFATNNF